MTARSILMTKRLFLSLMLVSSAHAQWEKLPPLPEPNGGFVCGHEKGQIIVVGGTNWKDGKKHWLSQKHLFEPATNTWSTDSTFDVAVAYAVPMQSDRGFSFMGGFDGTKARDPNIGVLAAGGGGPGFRVVVGGTNDPANISGVTNKTWRFGKGRYLMADYPDKPFAVAASAVAGCELLVFGGMNYDAGSKLPVNTDAAYAFRPSTNTWRALQRLTRANRGLSAVALDDTHVYLAGGYTDDFTADAAIYDVKADSYRAAPSLPYAGMVGLVNLDGFVYCLGGEDKKQSRTDKCYRIPVAVMLK